MNYDLIAPQSRDELTAEVNVLKTEIANLAAKIELLQVKIANLPPDGGSGEQSGEKSESPEVNIQINI